MLLIAAIAFTWFFAIAVIGIAWSRISAHARWQAGIDEDAYIHGLDDESLAEAA